MLIYFCYFVLPSLNGGFRGDDAYNIYYYWSRGFWKLAEGILFFFTSYYRPMGGLYFYSLYEIFGLNPFPYHVVIIVLLLINVFLVYSCATLLSRSKTIGGFCAILMTYHGNMALLLYAPAFVFDVLCFTFYFAALLYYLHFRCSGKNLGKGQLLIFVFLYIAALESKEMAVSLPVMIMAYEILWHRPARSVGRILEWLHTTALPALVTGCMTVLFIVGKLIGPDALSDNLMYRPIISWGRFIKSNVRYVEDLFYLKPDGWFNEGLLVLVWILVAYAAIRTRRNHLVFSLIMIVIAPLPIAFIPARGGPMLYVPCFGWAVIFATLIDGVCSFLSSKLFLFHINVSLAKALPVLLSVTLIWYQTDFHRRRTDYEMRLVGRELFLLKDQLTTLLPKVKSGTQIAFYNDSFPGLEAKYITELFYKDRSVNVRLNGKTPLSCSELNRMDYVLGFEQEKLAVLKRVGEVFKPPQSETCQDPRATVIYISDNETTAFVKAGEPFEVDFPGTAAQSDVCFDVRYLSPGTSVEQIVVNWQCGTSSRHTVPVSAPPGKWIITGIRAHRDPFSPIGEFKPVKITLEITR